MVWIFNSKDKMLINEFVYSDINVCNDFVL